jgi:hypothetical protein
MSHANKGNPLPNPLPPPQFFFYILDDDPGRPEHGRAGHGGAAPDGGGQRVPLAPRLPARVHHPLVQVRKGHFLPSRGHRNFL